MRLPDPRATRNRTSSRAYLFGLCSLTAVLVACTPKPEAVTSSPPTVLVAEAVSTETPALPEIIARLDGSTNTAVHSTVSGYLVRQAYQEGAVVKPGDLLFLIDSRPFHAASGADAGLGTSQVRSPIPGVAGRAIPGMGDMISPAAILTTVSTVDPIRADFALPRSASNHAGSLVADHPALDLILPDGSRYPDKGKLYIVDPQPPSATGAIRAYGLFPNPEKVLRPGQYVKVRGVTQSITEVMIPKAAVVHLQGSDQVMVVGPDNKVQFRNVTLGDGKGDQVAIMSGLNVGERVVVDGTPQCQPGSEVTPKRYLVP